MSDLDDDIRIHAIKTFIDNNPDFESFKHLPLIPDHWSGGDSFIPAFQKQIDFLKSLYPLVSGVKFLKHMARIKEKILSLQNKIEEEELKVICHKLYM